MQILPLSFLPRKLGHLIVVTCLFSFEISAIKVRGINGNMSLNSHLISHGAGRQIENSVVAAAATLAFPCCMHTNWLRW